ncbi:hypothetical protein D3C71_1778330 [compost metagenome]
MRLRVLAHIGQRLLHHVQHLYLHIGGQCHALSLDAQVRGQTGLVFELGQRGAQCGSDVLGIGAGAEMHQQLAHIRQAFAYTCI